MDAHRYSRSNRTSVSTFFAAGIWSPCEGGLFIRACRMKGSRSPSSPVIEAYLSKRGVPSYVGMSQGRPRWSVELRNRARRPSAGGRSMCVRAYLRLS
jgi:hypothetical protein